MTNTAERAAELDRAAELRDKDPAAYARLSAQTRIAVGYHLAAKARAKDEAGE